MLYGRPGECLHQEHVYPGLHVEPYLCEGRGILIVNIILQDIYIFHLKDESGTIACNVCGQQGGLSFVCVRDQIVVFGQVNVYERGGSYQLYAREIRLDGEGVLYERFQAFKRELEEMGMFASNIRCRFRIWTKNRCCDSTDRSRDPGYYEHFRRRNPFVQLILYPALVQGEGAQREHCKKVYVCWIRDDIDVIIVGRGTDPLKICGRSTRKKLQEQFFTAGHR